MNNSKAELQAEAIALIMRMTAEQLSRALEEIGEAYRKEGRYEREQEHQ